VTGLLSAVADLIETLLTLAAWLALIIGAFVLFCWAVFGIGFAVAFSQVRRRRKRAKRQAAIGHDTIAMLCLCCNGARGNDCICTDDCGVPRCQASDPEEAVP
jgi:threonine/homoserine/homoserine lactone efflux protein